MITSPPGHNSFAFLGTARLQQRPLRQEQCAMQREVDKLALLLMNSCYANSSMKVCVHCEPELSRNTARELSETY